MSEILRKFKTEFPTLNTICVDCGDVFARHNGWECPLNPVRTAFSTEMTSLREIKDKLDALAESQKRIEEQLLTKAAASQVHVVAESQGKLLAALNDNELDFNASQRFVELFTAVGDLSKRLDAMDAGLHETAMRNYKHMLAAIGQLAGYCQVTAEIVTKLVRPTRKARKKARSAVGKGRA